MADVTVTQVDQEIAKRANLIWAEACGGPGVSEIAAALARQQAIEDCASKAEEYPSNEYAAIAIVRGIALAIRRLSTGTDE